MAGNTAQADGATNVVSLHDHPVVTAKQVYEGFSDRLNDMIDMSSLDAPTGSKRSTWLAEQLTSDRLICNRTSTDKWLTKNQPPKDANSDSESTAVSLHSLASYILPHIKGYEKTHPVRVISWLRYGEAAGDCPFDQKSTSVLNDNKDIHSPTASREVTILAAHLVNQLSENEKAIFNEDLMDRVIQYLEMKGVNQMDQIDESDRFAIKVFTEVEIS